MDLIAGGHPLPAGSRARILLDRAIASRVGPGPLAWALNAAFALSALAFAFVTYRFFVLLNSGVSDYSWGDVSWIHQAVFNFLHGRPLQTSIYYYSGDGVIGNPHPYANQLAMHINLSPYLFSFGYWLFPGLTGLYATVMLFNIAGFSWLIFLLLRSQDPDGTPVKYPIAMTILLLSNFFDIITYKCLFPLYQGVFILALHHAMLKGRRNMFMATAALFFLVSEDAALFAVTYAMSLFLVCKKDRFYPGFLLAAAVGYLSAVMFVLQPALKTDMLTEGPVPSDIILRLGRFLRGESTFFFGDVRYYAHFVPAAFAAVFLLCKGVPARVYLGSFLLVASAPASHWFITLVNGGGHHLMPITTTVILAVILTMGAMKIERGRGLESFRLAAALGLFLFCLAGFHRKAPRGPGPGEQALQAMATNQATIAAMRSIPKEKSVVYWTSRNVEGFVVDRNDIWRFPSYFDLADYLVMQKDTQDTFFEAGPETGGQETRSPGLNIGKRGGSALISSLYAGTHHSSGKTARVSRRTIDLLLKDLVTDRKTHVVEREDEHVLLLRRRERHEFIMPRSSVGFGWIRNLPRFLGRRYRAAPFS